MRVRRPSIAGSTLAVLAAVLLVTAGGFAATRVAIDNAEQSVLAVREHDIAGLAASLSTQATEAIVQTGLAAKASRLAPATIAEVAKRQVANGPMASIHLVERGPSGWRLVPGAGAGRSPIMLDRLIDGGASLDRAARTENGDAPVVGVRRDASGFTIAYATGADGSPDHAIYAETDVDAAVRRFFDADGIRGALYIGADERADRVLGTNVPLDELPLGGKRRREQVSLAGLPTTLVIASSKPLVGRAAMLAPWIVLGLGLTLGAFLTVAFEVGRRRREMAQALARHDPLTGLANRRELLHAALAAIADGRHDGGTALLLVDLDDFKDLNDARGHDAGDELLRVVARRLVTASGPDALCARLGGDEFAILLPAGSAEAAAERIVHDVAQPHDDLPGMRASIGIATARAGSTAHELLQDADLAMYEAKRGSSVAWRRFTPAMRDAANARHALRTALPGVAERGELRLVVQPSRAFTDGLYSVGECLVRWEHPERGLLGPAAFLAEAERTGEIVAIGRWVVREAARELAALRPAYPRLRLAVNASPRELSEPGYGDVLVAALEEAGLPRDAIALEITEQSLDDPAALEGLRALREVHGVPVAIDDFGAAHSSLSRLQVLLVGGIKFDRVLMPADPQGADGAFIGQLVTALHSRLSAVIAEGVETPEQVRFAEAAGFDYAQGYAIARPMPFADLPAWLDGEHGALAAASRIAIGPDEIA